MELTGQVDLPVVGSVDKRVVLAVGGLGAAFVGWRYWQARGSAGYDPDAAVDPGMEDPGVLPSVAGAVKGDNGYGLGDGTGTDAYGFTGKTNAQWSQYAASQLSQASDTWSYGTIVSALGQFIANRPLTRVQQQIVQAAIAVAGYPPEGSHSIIPGGDTPITVAPTGLKATAISSTEIELTYNTVAGAAQYRAYRSGVTQNVGTSFDGKMRIGGLKPNTSYSFRVRAVSEAGKGGPESKSVTGKTKSVTLKAPTGVKVSSVTKNSAKISWSAVSGADHYLIYINDVAHGTSDHSPYTVVSLRRKTRYRVKVKADTTSQGPGPASKSVTFTTRSK